jgi:hypothetical protein
MNSLKDIVVGQDLEKTPFCMVCDYTTQGDLCQFLGNHVAETTLSKSPNVPTLRYYTCLLTYLLLLEIRILQIFFMQKI